MHTYLQTFAIGSVWLLTLFSPDCSATEAPSPPQQILLERAIELPTNRSQVRVLRVVFPPGYKSPLHTHESPGPRYVVRGKLRIEEGGQTREFEAGQVFWETGNWMTAENVGNGEAEIVVVAIQQAK